jgi:hypothetical protein
MIHAILARFPGFLVTGDTFGRPATLFMADVMQPDPCSGWYERGETLPCGHLSSLPMVLDQEGSPLARCMNR